MSQRKSAYRFIPDGALEEEKSRTTPVQGLYAVLAANPYGGEDIFGMLTGRGWMPFITTDNGSYQLIWETAKQLFGEHAEIGGLRLVRFTSREMVAEID
jgi:hypothetical protein